MDSNKIGKFISNKRIKKGLTQEELSKKLGINRTSISKWERGINLPDISLLQSLCNELDISINELINGEENTPNKDKGNIINFIKSYNKEVKNKYLKNFIKIIILIIIFFSSLIMINNYNKFTMYKIHTTKTPFIIDGYLLESISKKGVFIQNIIYNDEYVGTNNEIITDSVIITLESNNKIINKFKKSSGIGPKPLHTLLKDTSFYIDTDTIKNIELDNLYLKIELEDNQDLKNNIIDLSLSKIKS